MPPQPPDRRPRRRRLLDGERQLAARRLRALADCARPRPRVCFLPTASGDADHYVVRFYRRFSPGCEASHVSLFRRDQGTGGVEDDLASHLLSQDLIYVGGGNVREHARRVARPRSRHDPAQGVAPRHRAVRTVGRDRCAGSSRRSAPSTAHPRPVRGLGLLPYSNCVHYDAEPARRAEYHRAVADGMRAGLRRRGRRRRCTSAARCLRAGRQLAPRRRRLPRRANGGGVRETPLEVSYLGAPTPAHGRARGGDRAEPRALHIGFGLRARPTSEGRRVSELPAVPIDSRIIFAMGGGGFTMEPNNPLLDDFVLSLAKPTVPRILFLPTASGDTTAQINAFKARFADRSCVPEHLSLFRLRETTRPLQEIGPRAGHHLRRGRLDAQPARDLAGARARSAASRGVARGHRARRPERGGDVLVPGRRHPLQRTARSDRRAGAAGRLADRPRRRRARAPAGVARRRARWQRCPAAGLWTTVSGCCSAGTDSSASSARAPGRARSASTRSPASSCASVWMWNSSARGLRAPSAATTRLSKRCVVCTG